jgi:hypothetical protein
VSWPKARSAETFAPIGQRENHRLDVYLAGGEVADVRLDGKSVWPTWFKLEWKGTGEMSAKIQGFRLATRYGDAITIHQDRP